MMRDINTDYSYYSPVLPQEPEELATVCPSLFRQSSLLPTPPSSERMERRVVRKLTNLHLAPTSQPESQPCFTTDVLKIYFSTLISPQACSVVVPFGKQGSGKDRAYRFFRQPFPKWNTRVNILIMQFQFTLKRNVASIKNQNHPWYYFPFRRRSRSVDYFVNQ